MTRERRVAQRFLSRSLGKGDRWRPGVWPDARSTPVIFHVVVVAIASCVWGLGRPAMAQDTSVTIEQLRPPASPAFELLGIAPASVAQPSTPRALAASILSSMQDQGGLPRNLAMEVSPYWLRSHPSFTFDDQFARGGFFHTLATTIPESFSISVGSTPRLAKKDTTGIRLAMGGRVLLWPGRAPRALSDLVDRYNGMSERCDAQIDSHVSALCSDSVKKDPHWIAMYDTIQRTITEPIGVVVQLAGGVSADSPLDSVQGVRWRRGGVWLSPAFRREDHVDFLGVVRYLHDAGGPDSASSDMGDIGGRLLWNASSSIALSAETIGRVQRTQGAGTMRTVRYGGLVEFRPVANWYLFYAFGKDFAAASAPVNRLFASLGLSVGFGQTPRIGLGT